MLAAALLASAAFAPAMAQDPAATVGTLHVNAGQIMVSSNGGDFATVSGDTAIHVGDRIQVADSSDANLTYQNGYVLHYESPGVYVVQPAPAGMSTSTAGSSAGASTIATAAIILTPAALLAAGLDSQDNVPPIDPAVSR
jgi:opacity protein-like surface antigen